MNFLTRNQKKSEGNQPLIFFNIIENVSDNKISGANLLDFQFFNPIYFLSRSFIITTLNGSFKFNVEMIKTSSSVIAQFINNNPNVMQYDLNINDEFNIMSKIEQLYLGSQVSFSANELFILKTFIKILNLTNFPQFVQDFKLEETAYNLSKYTFSIVKNNFLNFLQKIPMTFTISTRKNEYSCNSIGVNSSDIIYEYIQKNASHKNHFVYDFADDNDEFKIICDFLNYKSIKITPKNIQIIKKISQDLQIKCILEHLDNLINQYSNAIDSISYHLNMINNIEDLVECLYNRKGNDLNVVTNLLINSIWSNSEKNVQELTAYIYQVIIREVRLHPFLVDLLISLDQNSFKKPELKKLIPFLVQHLLNDIGSNKLNCAFIYRLHKKGIISKETIKKSIIKVFRPEICSKNYESRLNFSFGSRHESTNNSRSKNNIIKLFNLDKGLFFKTTNGLFGDSNRKTIQKNILIWFFTEISEINMYSMDKIIQEINLFDVDLLNLEYPKDIEKFKAMRDSGEPNDELTNALRNDDVEKLQKIIGDKSIDKIVVPFNLFESESTEIRRSLFYYCTYYDSKKCLEYLSTKLKQDNETIENESTDSKNSFLIISRNNILTSIEKHKNDTFDMILKNTPVAISDNLWAVLVEICKNGNIHSLKKLIENGFDLFSLSYNEISKMISYSAKAGFCTLTNFIFSIIFDENNQELLENPLKVIDFNDSVSFGSLSIFKMYELLNINNIDFTKSLKIAISRENLSLIKYMFESQFRYKFQISSKDALDLIKQSFYNNKIDVFNYLVYRLVNCEKNIKDFPNSFDDSILSFACSTGNKEIVEKICDLQMYKNPKLDCSESLFIAASYGYEEICKLLIDKKVFIIFSKINKKVSNFGILNKQIFELLYGIADKKQKEQFKENFLYKVIMEKNKELIEFLLKSNAQHDRALFEAVLTNDVEIVNLILKYDNEPSFINKLSENGTALMIAVESNNLDICKSLLSIKDIDPSICVNENETPFIAAFDNLNIYIIDLFFNFYGESIQSQTWQINKALKKILMKIPIKKSDELYKKQSILPLEKKSSDAPTSNNSKNSQPSSGGWKMGFGKQNTKVVRGWGANDSLNTKQNSTPINGWGKMQNDKIDNSKTQNIKFGINFKKNSNDSEDTPNSDKEKKLGANSILGKTPKLAFSLFKDKENSQSKLQIQQDMNKPKFHFQKFRFSMDQKESDSKVLKGSLKLSFDYASSKKQPPSKIPIPNEQLIKIIIKKLLTIKNLDINYQTADFSLLSYACENNEKEIVKTLLKSNRCDVNQYTQRNGNSPLMTAIFNKNYEIAGLLIQLPSTNINHQNYINETALIYAIQNQSTEIIDLIVNDKRFDPIESCLNFGFFISNNEIAQQLISIKNLNVNYYYNKSDNKQKSKQTESTLVRSVNNGDAEKVDLIISHPTFSSINKEEIIKAIFASLSNSSLEIFKKLLPLINNDVNIHSVNGESLLYAASMNKNLSAILEIIINPNFDSAKSEIDEVYAVLLNEHSDIPNFEILDILKKIDEANYNLININKILSNGKTYLTNSIKNSNIEYVNYLLKHGADPDLPDQHGEYPLQIAINLSSFLIVESLIKTGKIDLNRRLNTNNSRNVTYLHLAAKSDDSKVLEKILMLNMIDVNAVDNGGETPLMIAARNQKIDNIILLFQREDLDYLCCNVGGDDVLAILGKQTSKYFSFNPPKSKDIYKNILITYITDLQQRKKCSMLKWH